MDFQQRLSALRDFNIKVELDKVYKGGYREVDLIRSVILPLSAQEWMEVLQEDGPYNISDIEPEVQDIFHRAFLKNGEILASDLKKVADVLIEASDETPEEPVTDVVHVQEAKKQWRVYNPFDKALFAWHMVDGYYSMSEDEAPHRTHKDDLDDAFQVITKSSFMLYMREMFDRNTSEETANRILEVRRLTPALRTALNLIKNITPDPVTGYALIDLNQGPEAVATNGNGYCFYYDRKGAEDTYKLWKSVAKIYDFKDRPLGVRQVKLSVENGFEFLDDGPQSVI